MKKQLPAIILGIVCAGLTAAYINANKTINRLRGEITQFKEQPDASPEPDVAPRVAIPAPVNQSEELPESPPPDRTPAPEPAVAVPPAEEETASGRRMAENMAKMMDNPTMNKVMEASQRGAVGALYMDLIEQLKLDGAETDYFMDLLMYRQMAQMEAAMKLMSGEISEEEKQALQEGIEEAKDFVSEEMKKFLNNDEDFAEFEFYEETMGERMMLSQMDRDLESSGAKLSDETYRDLLGIMHQERENFVFTSDLHDDQNPDMSAARFSKENVDNYAKDIRRLNESLFQKAQPILAPEQYAAFVNSLKSFTDLQLSQLEMAARMFGDGK